MEERAGRSRQGTDPGGAPTPADQRAAAPGGADPGGASLPGRQGPGFRGRPRVEVLALGDELGTLAAQIAAASARFLQVLGEFDACEGWRAYEGNLRSAAHWLSWRAGMDLRTAREQLRVARRLRALPVTARAFAEGRLSYSEVRAISRVSTPDTEQDMVDIATHAPAAHVERLTRSLVRAADGNGPAAQEALPGGAEAAAERLRHRRRGSRRWDDETGELVLWARFSPTDGATMLAAFTRAELERIRTTDHEPDEEDPAPRGEGHPDGSEDQPGGAHTAWPADLTGPAPTDPGPALVAMAQLTLSGLPTPVHAPAAEVIFLHGPAYQVAGVAPEEGTEAPEESVEPGESVGPPGGEQPEDGSAEPPLAGVPRPASRLPHTTCVADGPGLDEAAAEGALCTAAVRHVRMDAGVVIDYGRRRRKVSPGQLRALQLRDRGCRTPGCGRTRFLHAHHVLYWSRNGRTDLANLILLCTACHTSVHLGLLSVTALGDQRFEFRGKDGALITQAPATFGTADLILSNRLIEPTSVSGDWGGEPLDLPLATSMISEFWTSPRREPWWKRAGLSGDPAQRTDAKTSPA